MANTQTYKYKAEMACEACANAIKKSLTKSFGNALVSFDANLEQQTIEAVLDQTEKSFTYDEVYETMKKTGRNIEKIA